MFPTRSKDVNISILLKLPDRDLGNICLVNKHLYNLCRDEDFWYRKINYMFPYLSQSILKKYKGDRSWTRYYIQDLSRYNHMDPNKLLISTSSVGSLDGVLIALNNGANVHVNDDWALRWASENGHTDIVKVLLEAGADVHAWNDKALGWASVYGHIETVRVLLEATADIHALNDQALRYASKEGRTDIVKVLLDAGADVYALDNQALRWATENGHTDTVKVLLELAKI